MSVTTVEIRVPRDTCGSWNGDHVCGSAAPYAVYFDNCPPCINGRGYRACAGHGVCDVHAIDARNGNRRSYLDGTRLKVQRIKHHGAPGSSTLPVSLPDGLTASEPTYKWPSTTGSTDDR